MSVTMAVAMILSSAEDMMTETHDPRLFHDEAASAYAESSILEIKQLHEGVAEAEC